MFNDLMNNTNYVIAVLANNVAGNGAATTLIVTTSGPQGMLCVYSFLNGEPECNKDIQVH